MFLFFSFVHAWCACGPRGATRKASDPGAQRSERSCTFHICRAREEWESAHELSLRFFSNKENSLSNSSASSATSPHHPLPKQTRIMAQDIEMVS